MKKLILICFAMAFASGEGIFANYFKNEKRMEESLVPSFDCDLESNSEVEMVICCATRCGMTREPTIIFLDNFFY